MSAFIDAVSSLIGKETYFISSDGPVKAIITKIDDDLVVIKLTSPVNGYDEFATHINSLSWVTGAS